MIFKDDILDKMFYQDAFYVCKRYKEGLDNMITVNVHESENFSGDFE